MKKRRVVAALLCVIVTGVVIAARPQIRPKEDCIPYNVGGLQLQNRGENGWRLVDGTSGMLLLDNEADAQAALALARKFTHQCFIGRDNKRQDRNAYIVQYWK